jgi:anti-sigma factor RsiW
MTDRVNPHLSNDTLNEFLDGALDGSARAEVEAHLAACRVCSARLEVLGAVFAGLASLPQLALGRDLRSGVMAAVRAQNQTALRPFADPRRPAIQVVFALQLLAALALIAFAWPFLASLAQPAPLIGSADINRFVAQLAGAWLDFGGLWLALERGLTSATAQPALPLEMLLQPVVAGLVLVGGGVLWLLGNALLLRPRPAFRWRRNS